MSFDINWSQLVDDPSINSSIKDFLALQLLAVSLPSYIDNLTVTDFLLGDEAPEVIIRDIGDTFDAFYEDEEGPRTSGAQTATAASAMDSLDSSDNDDYDESRSSLAGEVTLSEAADSRPFGRSMPFSQPIQPMSNRLRRAHTALAASPLPTNAHLNALHAHNINHLGLGPLHINSITPSGRDTPTHILHLMRTGPGGTQLPPTPATAALGTNSAGGPGNHLHQPKRGKDDVQIIAEVKYKGNLHIEVTVDLFLNYPSERFVTLPIKLHITGFEIHSLVCIAYLQQCVYFSFLCDVSDVTNSYFSNDSGGNFVDYMSGQSNKERIDIIKKVKIESEIGEVESNVLRNVGKVEKFLVEKVRSIIREETAWPSWLCFDMSE